MSMYLTRFSYTPETWDAMIERPEDRRDVAREIIEPIAAHCDGYLPWCSSTRRTARSRISIGYLPGLVIAPSSHSLESPLFPGRFSWLSPVVFYGP